ncbi:MAG: IPTL-CTERM sorting domain-containing protein [Casimicrobiaceae bacterium]
MQRYFRGATAASRAVLAGTIFAMALGSAAGQTLTKTGKVTSATSNFGSTTQAANGETLGYVMQYANPSAMAVELDLKDAIPAGTAFVPGSLVVPPQFSRQWSIDGGSTWLTVEPASGVTNARAQTLNPILYSGGSSFLGNLAVPPKTTLSTGGASGDGYRAIPLNGNVYIINHHSGTTYLDCFSETTGTRCTNYPVHPSAVTGTAFSTAAYSTASANWTGTPGKPLEYVDRSNSKIYYPANDFNGHPGVMCVDVVNSVSCGFVALYTGANLGVGGGTGNFPGYNAVQPGPSGRLYIILDNSGTMYCYNAVTAAACSGSPFTVPATTSVYNELSLRIGGKSIISSPNTNAQVFCWDHAAAALCAGWSIQTLPGNSYVQLYPVVDATGTPTGVCVRGLTTFAKSCFNLDGSPYTAPASFLAWMDNYVAGYYGSPAAPGYSFGDTTYYATRTFASGQPGGAGPWVEGCYDWSVPGDCAGNAGETWPVNGGNVTQRQYSTIADVTLPGCMWMNGDDGVIGSFWALDGGICGGRTSLLATITPDDLTCDGLSHAITWDNIALSGLTAADYTTARIIIRDAGTNAPIPGFNNVVVAAFPLDISGISFASYPSLIFDLQLSGIPSTAPWSANPPPYTTVNWNGPGPQVCFSAQPTSCATPSLTNSASMITTIPGGGSSTISASANAFIHILDAACATPGLIALTKEVCTDPTPANCTAVSGNWVASTNVPSGSTVSWRIKVTNTSAVDEARNVTLTDAVAPACVTAAGSFTLAPLASATFVCASANVTVATTNTATAGGTLVIAGVPPGTSGPPVGTNPGSADANPLAVPGATKAFSPLAIGVGQTALLTITLTNPNAVAATGVAFTDNYPANLVNTATPGGATTCGGTPTAAASGTSLTLSGGTIPGNGSCTVTVNVTSAVGGSYVNTTGAISTSAGSVPAAQGTLTVIVPTVAKSFTPATIGFFGVSVLTIAVTNTSATTAITSVAFTDNYPANLQNTAAPAAASTCGGTVTAAPNGTALAFSGGTVAPNSVCAITVNVTSALAGTYVNSSGVVTTGNAGTAGPASSSLVVTSTAFSAAKAFSPSSVNPGGTAVLSITLTNPNPGAVTGVAFTDNYPAGLVNTSAPGAVSACGGTVTAAPNGSALALTGGTIPSNGSCTVSVNVTLTSGGTVINSIGAVTSSNAGSSGPTSAALAGGGNAIPTLSPWALASLASLMLLGAAFMRRGRRD